MTLVRSMRDFFVRISDINHIFLEGGFKIPILIAVQCGADSWETAQIVQKVIRVVSGW